VAQFSIAFWPNFKLVITFLDDFGNIRNSFTVANLRSDIDKLYNYGVGLANTGTENVLNRLLQRSDFHGLVSDRITYIANVVNNSYSFYKSLDQSIGNTLLSLIGGKENVSRLFTFSNYDLTSWLSDYRSSELGQYYTQRWYIYRQDSGEEVIFDYTPATDTESIAKGGEWVRFTTTDADFYPTAAQLKQVLANSETYAGHTIDEINQLASSNDGYSYEVTRKLKCYALTSKGEQYAKAYAYAIKAVRSWDKKEEVYEDTFDSYSMDFDTFSALMNQQLAELNDNEDGSKYYLDSDSKRYYLSANSTKIQGSESVIISVTCSDSATLIEGNTQYKCKTCGSSLDDHTKECSMLTTVTDNEISTAELDKLEKQYAIQAKQLQAQIDELEARNAELEARMYAASPVEASYMRQEYDEHAAQIQEFTTQLNDIKKKQAALEEALQEAETDDELQTDDYYRIPAIMNDCKTAYSLTWKGDGVWSGFTFTREASAPNINGTIKFVATLKMVRKPKTFLGIKIHRAIIGIEWKLTADYTVSQVVEVVELDKSKSDKENTQLVNDKISEVAQDYPSCTITTEYIGNEELEADASVDTQHLLWASDRLEIAREIDSRITKIYTDLVSLEKFMHYKRSIVDVLKDIAPSLNATQGKKLTITEEAHERWMNSAKYLGKEGGTK
jgi:hypothetical protein